MRVIAIIRELSIRQSGHVLVEYRCGCGATKIGARSDIKNGKITSCGCLKIARTKALGKANLIHGHAKGRTSKTPTYHSWRAMHQRCHGRPPGHKDNRNYLERGIVICERWRSFENFLADMGERPAGKTLDRYPDNIGNYEPGNCRWATAKEQAVNRRKRRESL